MNCIYCGAVVGDRDNFCGNCGAEKAGHAAMVLKSNATDPLINGHKSANRETSLRMEMSQRTKVTLLILVVLVVLLITALYVDHSSSPDSDILNSSVISAAIGCLLYGLVGAVLIRLVKRLKLGWRAASITACWVIPSAFILGALAIYVPRAIQDVAAPNSRIESVTQKSLSQGKPAGLDSSSIAAKPSSEKQQSPSVLSTIADPARLAEELNKRTPLMRGDGQRIDKVIYSGKVLYFYVTLVSHRSDEINPDALYSEYKPLLIQAACSEDTITQLLRSGHVVDYRFSGNDGAAINDVPIMPQDCNSRTTQDRSQ